MTKLYEKMAKDIIHNNSKIKTKKIKNGISIKREG